MSQGTLTVAAADRLAADPKLETWKKEETSQTVPILGYYQRSYFTSDEGNITEFGDGFMLTFDRADMDWAAQGLTTETVLISNDCKILVVAPHALFLNRYQIDWNEKKYAYNPIGDKPSLS